MNISQQAVGLHRLRKHFIAVRFAVQLAKHLHHGVNKGAGNILQPRCRVRTEGQERGGGKQRTGETNTKK